MFAPPSTVRVRTPSRTWVLAVGGAGPVDAPPPVQESVAVGDVVVGLTWDGTRAEWSVANRGDRPVPVDAVALGWDLGRFPTAPAMYVNGYQSWSPTGRRVLGEDADPSRAAGGIDFLRHVHHADPTIAPPDELRSELVTVLDLPRRARRLVGFLDGATHDGTVRVRADDTGVLVWAEAWLGGAVLAPGEQRRLHPVVHAEGDDPATLLDVWAHARARTGGARAAAPYQVGWCSWYQYFHRVTERAVRDNLARASSWPFEVFQVDDGFQAAIGDWTEPAPTFPGGVERLAADIADAGFVPGLWLAPFLAAPDSRLATDHPEFLARAEGSDEPLVGMWNEEWGGRVLQLDTTAPAVLAHLEATARSLREMGYSYLKVDFTFSPSIPGRYADPGRTPAERVRLGYEAIRRGLGDDGFLLACGCPLGPVAGIVDAMRIGPDVAPTWERAPDTPAFAGYEDVAPATRGAWTSTLARSFLHRRLWLNDPDCLLLRRDDTDLSADEARAWALAVGLSGGLALVSDDLALLDDGARALLDEVLALGRASDAASRSGPAPRCEDLLAPGGPRRLAAAGWTLEADPDRPRAALRRDEHPADRQ